ncbi:uncharacterized protein LOC131317306 [Rhododendron vialii]|uniref:uncharacterized protein LOC131317306 n=1 Tax=Rhododendron vialii TaxID=182163 RepID=UPI00265FECC4|nr:uncharacterized protein LOC131317306 [Rhododendron vialii]
MKALMQSQISFTEQTKQAIGDIRTQLTQLTAVVGQVQQEKRRFPSQPQVNAANTHFVGDSSGPSNLNPRLEEANAIITLRSGKVIDKDLPPKKKSVPPTVPVAAPAVVPDLGSVPEEERKTEPPKVVVPAPAVPMTQTPPVAPYPNRLVAKPKANVNFQILELVKKADIPTKCKDPGCPTIPIVIAGQKFDKALLDLGASVNLLPYSVYLRLGLGDLRAIPVTLQLADRSIRIPKGVVEDVLVQVGEFLFPVDFIVLDTCQIPEEHVDSILYKDPLEIALTAKEASFLDFSEVWSLIEMPALYDACGATWDPVLEPLGASLS